MVCPGFLRQNALKNSTIKSYKGNLPGKYAVNDSFLIKAVVTQKTLFLDPTLRLGGFYELAIQICPSVERTPVELYQDYFWQLDLIDGPFDANCDRTAIDYEHYSQQGLLTLESYTIPFKLFNIREQEPIESGFSWLTVSFYTTAIEHVFGSTYGNWLDDVNAPPVLHQFLVDLLTRLFRLYPFQLALVGFEVSGECYLDDLKTGSVHHPQSEIYISRSHVAEINVAYRDSINLAD